MPLISVNTQHGLQNMTRPLACVGLHTADCITMQAVQELAVRCWLNTFSLHSKYSLLQHHGNIMSFLRITQFQPKNIIT